MKKSALILVFLTALMVVIQVVHTVITSVNVPPSKIISIIVNGQPTWGLILPIFGYILAVLGLLGVVIVNALLCRHIFSKWLTTSDRLDLLALFQFAWIWAGILIVNSWLLPRSLFSYELEGLFSGWKLLLVLTGFVIGFVIELVTLGVLFRQLAATRKRALVVGLVACSGLYFVFGFTASSPLSDASTDQPHILIIGVDSLRADVFDRDDWRARIPNIDEFMSQATRFETAITPLARTYPAWVSILSGQSPRNSGARINLVDPSLVKKDQLLTNDLQDLGYQTIFATDERRFSNIDESYGFDDVVGPGYGGADFIIGYLSDFPIVNVVSSSALGPILFPYIAQNRAIPHSYSPDQFSSSLETYITSLNPAEPTFFVAHFCLPHWPYIWSSVKEVAPQKDGQRDPELSYSAQNYWFAIEEADRQVGMLLEQYRREGWLDNALVILLSDHGEAFGFEADVLDEVGDISRNPFPNEGHGLNIFSEYQNRIVLGVRYYGAREWIAGVSDQVAGTIDLRPTINEVIGQPVPFGTTDGISLVPWLTDVDMPSQARMLEMESGFTVKSFSAAGINVAEVVNKAFSFYSISEDGRFEIREDQALSVIESKHLGITNGQMVVGASPNRDGFDWYVADWSSGTIGRAEELTVCGDECEAMKEIVIERFEFENSTDGNQLN